MRKRYDVVYIEDYNHKCTTFSPKLSAQFPTLAFYLKTVYGQVKPLFYSPVASRNSNKWRTL